jgi:hypothetical protein
LFRRHVFPPQCVHQPAAPLAVGPAKHPLGR